MTNPVGNRSLCLAVMVSALVVTPAGALYAQDSPQKVTSIEVRGNKRIEESAIRSRLTLNVGDPYTANAIRAQIRLIYAIGFFEDVQIEAEPAAGGLAVILVVREKPFITEIVFDGNENLNEDKLREKTTIRSQSFLDQQEVKESAERIESAYRDEGYANAGVIPIIQTLEEDRKRLTFYIKEGDQLKIDTVIFDGAEAVSKKELLKMLANRETVFFLSLFTDAGILRREELGNDVERIKEVYLNKGYLNVQVSLPVVELTEDRQGFTVTYTIVEGEPFTVGEVGFRGNTVFEEQELMKESKVKPGEVFQRAAIREEKTRLEDLYGGKGYAFALVTPSVVPNPQTKTAGIIFRIEEGEMMRVNRITIRGNDKTRDNVIRRELRLNEQEVIDTKAMKRSFQRLNNLNFFETVEIFPKKVAPDKVDLDVKVKEKPTGTFSIGGGFSSLDRLTAIADITEGNLFGRGHLLRVRGQLGQRRTLGVISFREPHFRDSLTSVQLDAFSTETDFLTYTEEKAGGGISFGRWFSEFTSGNVSLVGEALKIGEVEADAPDFVKDQEGNQSTTGFRSSIARDTRDFFLDPRTGMRSSLSFDLGTPALGGTNNFYKLGFDNNHYTPLFLDTRHSIRARFGLSEGLGGKAVPLTERFFVGGINTMRGFEFGRAGPVTPTTGTLLGGTKQIIINNEFIFPISAEAKLNGVLFFDYGRAFNDAEALDLDLREAAGIEVRWISPFGPLRLAYGINLDPGPLEKGAVFEFSVGSLF